MKMCDIIYVVDHNYLCEKHECSDQVVFFDLTSAEDEISNFKMEECGWTYSNIWEAVIVKRAGGDVLGG